MAYPPWFLKVQLRWSKTTDTISKVFQSRDGSETLFPFIFLMYKFIKSVQVSSEAEWKEVEIFDCLNVEETKLTDACTQSQSFIHLTRRESLCELSCWIKFALVGYIAGRHTVVFSMIGLALVNSGWWGRARISFYLDFENLGNFQKVPGQVSIIQRKLFLFKKTCPVQIQLENEGSLEVRTWTLMLSIST